MHPWETVLELQGDDSLLVRNEKIDAHDDDRFRASFGDGPERVLQTIRTGHFNRLNPYPKGPTSRLNLFKVS
jgi:hypothetical protein